MSSSVRQLQARPRQNLQAQAPMYTSCVSIQPSACPRLLRVSISFPHGTLYAAVQLTVHSNWRTPDIPHVLLSKSSIVYRVIDEFYQRSCTVSSLEGSLLDLLLRTSNEGWFISSIWSIWSIWFVWLGGPKIHPKEPDRPERPSNQTDEPRAFREHRRPTGSPPS